jgi:hypothetical protein
MAALSAIRTVVPAEVYGRFGSERTFDALTIIDGSEPNPTDAGPSTNVRTGVCSEPIARSVGARLR